MTLPNLAGYTPSRVIVNAHGEATTARRAREQGIDPKIIFLRNDGWSLAAPPEFETLAFNLWRNEWTHYVRAGQQEWNNISWYGK